MEWYVLLLLLFGSLIILMSTGMPVVLSFMLISVVALFFTGGTVALEQLTLSLYGSLTSFALMPVPPFILMGEVMFVSGVGALMMDALDKWLGRVPGRLSLLAVGGGTLFATLTGASMGSVAMLGSVLVPEMERRGYKKPMTLGPILGSGGLAIMIPPSSLAVLLGSIAEISIGKILIAIIIPGLLLAIFYAAYIITRCMLQPSIAPAYDVPHISLLEKVTAIVRYVLPIGIVVFLVIGIIFLGVATPTEASATGVLGVFLLALLHRRLSWEVLKKSVASTIQITVMMFMLVAAATAFSEFLALTGASRHLMELVVNLPLEPILIVIAMQVVALFLGMFIAQLPIMMISIPIFMPIVIALDFNPVWFVVIFLLNMEMAGTSPPFGLSLFVMKGVAPPDTTMGDIYKAALPFLYLDAIVMALIIAFPAIALWLPGLMR